ncbi:MAG TPA: hypothetical protein VFF53_10615, partial [Geobacteraceae bacterium]|nr:hypothetical protein [Geobacteraceae bacterium]
ATRSEITGVYNNPVEKNLRAEKVSVFFLFRHLEQEHGYDTIPKLKATGVKDFDNIFRDALGEISNISSYTTFVESPTDVNVPKRRQELEGLRRDHDYTMEVSFFEESSFKQQCLSGTISLISLTLIPMPYSWDYTITARLTDRSGKLVNTYERKATLSNWVELFLMFAYPFYPLEGKREEIYSKSLHDIFLQTEAEKVLKK